ncbi:GFA family protein [Agarivorans gilvus]|uniref:S-(Hydroxymethyl)glutathione synthase n=1 Tax=Agarivorans gilvus TaxID=680279 RepID=A0ABQ1I7P7_9ALTE|nr:GFA family protein [Agarivorans gilvus]GGB18230.1 S-(hydroxymethyl)glutathione synthase [Agarivorans gilvus]
MSEQHQGSCLCGQVHYSVSGEFDSFYLCYCRHCQKDSGSAHAANLFSSQAKLTWLSGEALVRTYQLPNSRHVKSFCQHCGSALPAQLEGLLQVPAGSLDSELILRPRAKIFMASAAKWRKELKEVPSYQQLPDDLDT